PSIDERDIRVENDRTHRLAYPDFRYPRRVASHGVEIIVGNEIGCRASVPFRRRRNKGRVKLLQPEKCRVPVVRGLRNPSASIGAGNERLEQPKGDGGQSPTP